MPEYARAIGGPPPKRVPAFVARFVLGKAFTTFLTTSRGIANVRIKTELGWRPQYKNWRGGFSVQ